MVNWHDPTLLQNESSAFINLTHVMAGIYFWETVFTAGFELDVLRRKRPYKWTIWLYLGTRYTLLFAFIFLIIDLNHINGPRLPCKSLVIAILTLFYVSWAFASFIIVLRIIAIWNRNTIVSLIAVGALLSGLALNIRHLTIVTVTYIPLVNACRVQHKHDVIVNAIGALVVDLVLLLTMLIGLLRLGARNSGGIWNLLYQQCIIWLALALLAEIPPVVLLILNLNDIMNEMLHPAELAILSICAARMYRSLCDRGSLTQYVSSDPTQFLSMAPNPTAQIRGTNGSGPMRFISATQSEGTRTMYEARVFPPVDQIYAEFIPSGSFLSLTLEDTNDSTESAGYKAV